MITLVKMSLKLLLRNKGFLFFLIVTPALSAFILSVKMDHTIYKDGSDKQVILELKDYTEKAVYVGDTSACIIKVYDASNSELSEYVLNQMAATGMFSVCRADVSGLTEEEVEKKAKKDAFDDRAGLLLYLKKDFDEAVLDGTWKQGVKLYVVSEDEKVRNIFTEGKVFFATLSYASEVLVQSDKNGIDDDAVSTMIPHASIYLPFAELVDIEKEIERLKKEQERLTKELARVNGMLSNPNFVNHYLY